MKDCFGRKLAAGDWIAYVERYGSNVKVSQRRVVEVHEKSCKASWIDFVYKGGVGRPVEKVTSLQTPHLIVLLAGF